MDLKLNFKLKLLIGVVLTFLCFYFLSDHLAQVYIFNSFEKMEQDSAISDIGRITYYLQDSFTTFDEVVHDWATWDDSYVFVKNRNPDFLHSNLLPQTYQNLNIDLILFCDEQGKPIFSKELSGQSGELVALTSVKEKAILEGLLCRSATEAKRGLLGTVGGTMKVVSRPILRSDGSGPVRGTLIMGRFIDQARIEKMISITHLLITPYSLNQPNLPEEIRQRLPDLKKSIIKIEPAGRELLVGYLTLTDVFRQPVLVLRVEIPRDLNFQSHLLAGMISLIRLTSFFLTGMVTLLLLQVLVINPIGRANKTLQEIMAKCDLVKGATVTGKDELEKLQNSVSAMLTELEQRHPTAPPKP